MQVARESLKARAKLDIRGLISREDVSQTARDSDNIVLTKMISRETKMISRETKMISRETKRCRAKVQTNFADSD